MFSQVLAADARGLAALEGLRGRTDPEEMEACFRALAESVAAEEGWDVEAIGSDLEWKTALLAELSFELPPGWAEAAVACWAEKPWLRDLPS